MSVYRTKNGARLTDEDIERLGEAAERGEGSRQDAKPAHTGGTSARTHLTGRQRATRTGRQQPHQPISTRKRTDFDAEYDRSRRKGAGRAAHGQPRDGGQE